MLAPGRAKPKPTPETKHFWDGAKQGKLLLQRCGDTGRAYFPPRPFSPYTGTRNVTVFEASGRATLHSYVIHHRPVPGFTPPYAIAVVELEEGPRMMTNIVDCDLDAIKVGQRVKVAFKKTEGDFSMPVFAPA